MPVTPLVGEVLMRFIKVSVLLWIHRGDKESKETVSQGDGFIFKTFYSIIIWSPHSNRFTANVNFL